jgi:lysozyme
MYPDGSKVLLGQTITQDRADELLAWEVDKKATVIDAYKIKFNQSQFDACTSFCYNCGLGAFNKSTIKRLANINPDDPAIRDAFMMWSKARVNGVLQILKGLERRRRAEADLYFSHSL